MFDVNTAIDPSNRCGGAIYVGAREGGPVGSITLTADSTETGKFTGNKAQNGGGAIFITGGSEAVINNYTFQGNQVTGGGGGAIEISGSGTLNVTDCDVKENKTPAGNGGVLWADSGEATFTTTEFTGNTAKGGGVFYLKGSANLTVDSCAITGNSAVNNQGGVLWDNGGTGTVTFKAETDPESAKIIGNTAKTEGGALWKSKGTLNISGYTIQDNEAPKYKNGYVDSNNVSGNYSDYLSQEGWTES